MPPPPLSSAKALFEAPKRGPTVGTKGLPRHQSKGPLGPCSSRASRAAYLPWAQVGPTVSARQRRTACLTRGVTCRRASSSESDGFITAVRRVERRRRGGQNRGSGRRRSRRRSDRQADGGARATSATSGRTRSWTARRRPGMTDGHVRSAGVSPRIPTSAEDPCRVGARPVGPSDPPRGRFRTFRGGAPLLQDALIRVASRRRRAHDLRGLLELNSAVSQAMRNHPPADLRTPRKSTGTQGWVAATSKSRLAGPARGVTPASASGVAGGTALASPRLP